ncbi:MAG: DUF4358 domain-containing protein [Lachnospiraceae bacterium]|nr:DUF4358 domain-containing protein [Lachnospiraceae bacterium]
MLGRWKIFAADLLRILALAAIILFLMVQFKGSRISTAAFEDVSGVVIAASGLPAAPQQAEITEGQEQAQEQTEAAETQEQTPEQAETAEVPAQAQEQVQAPAQPGDNQMFKRLYGLDPEAYDGVLLYYPTTNMNAEELLLIKLKGSSQEEIREQQEIVQTAMETRRQTQMHTFEGYAPQQYATLEHSVIDVQGNYLLFVSGDFAQQTQIAFEKSLAQ